MQDIYIFMTVDENFLEHALVVFRGIKFHTSGKIILYLCVPDKKTEHIYRNKLTGIVSENFRVEIILFTGMEEQTIFFEKFEKNGYHLTKASFFRLFIAEFVPQKIKKIIYLDADLIINTDLRDLYEIELKKTIGGVNGYFGKKWTQKYLSKLHIEIMDYINSGVLIIDLVRWRKLNLQNKMIGYAEKNPEHLKLGDQDLINIFFQGEIEYLEPRWNNIVWFTKTLSPDRNCIFHAVGKIKANSLFFSNYEVKKMYDFFNGRKNTILGDVKIISIFVFWSYMVNAWKMVYNKRALKYEKMQSYDYFLLFILLLHPGVFYIFISKIYKKLTSL